MTATRKTAAIDATLATGNPVIVGLNAYGGTHFVVLVSGSNGNYLMRDPYITNGNNISFSAHYSLRNIFSISKVVDQQLKSPISNLGRRLYNGHDMKMSLQTAKELLIIIVLGLVSLAILVFGGIGLAWHKNQQPPACNTADIKLYGALVYYPSESDGASPSALGDGSSDQTASEDIRAQIEAADSDPGVKAILLQIDSPGGDPVAGEDVADALKHASKPTVALVADEGTSAAYWAATGAQTIFASANSSVADIGVTQSYLDRPSRIPTTGCNSSRSRRESIRTWAIPTRRSRRQRSLSSNGTSISPIRTSSTKWRKTGISRGKRYRHRRRFADARPNGASGRLDR